jgi:outer membrane protein assembly factor BamB
MSTRGLFIIVGVGAWFMLAAQTFGAADGNWPQFRGPAASGVSHANGPTHWDVKTPTNLRWKVPVPGLGHSSPVIWGDRIFLTTALPVQQGDETLKTGLYGDVDSVQENAEYRWMVLCFDKATGKQLWEREAHRGVPRVKRHPKSTHANSTPATDGKRVVAFFGSEGLYCYDLDGNPLWQKDFGLLDSGFFIARGAQWGFGSSPVLFQDKVIVLADVQENSFVAALNAADGEQLWRTARDEVPTWGTPTVLRGGDGDGGGHGDSAQAQVAVNGFREIAGYDIADGKKRWTMKGGGDIPVPTPVAAHGLIYVTSAHGLMSPIYAIKSTAQGDITLPLDRDASAHVAWSIRRGGNYMQTPIVVGDYLYCCRDNGVLTCFDAKTGKQMYRTRLDGTGFTASAVAAGERIYFTAEDGRVHVIKAGPEFESLAENDLGESCLSTPALSGGTIFFRTRGHLIAIGEP